MELIDRSKVKGIIEVQQSFNGKDFFKIAEFNNLFTDEGFKNYFDLLTGASTAYEISHGAVGSGSSTAAVTDTVVESHIETVALTSSVYSKSGSNHILTNTLDLNAAQGNGTIRKVGLIAFGPTTVLGGNYDPTLPNKSGAEWKLINYADVLLPNGKVKTSSITIKFIWKLIFV